MFGALIVLAAVDIAVESPPTDLLGWAAVITAVGVAFASIASALTLVITKRTDKKVTQIDHAVNGQPPGTKAMVDQVQDLHAQIPVPLTAKAAWLEAAVSAIADAQGVVLPDRPPNTR